ncbi:unnamed protein product [Mytilus coruscus]|uniref:VWFA domain-containing protein n=1 Tax=Mytilus coruscus TaxID=42192 RepID=A0A6J8D776_MYTCO|nr:unnamed protein product [Mytilus coruscus]
MNPRGGISEINKGLNHAVNILYNRNRVVSSSQVKKYIILLSDGLSSTPSLISTVSRYGRETLAVAVGEDVSHNFLSVITGGSEKLFPYKNDRLWHYMMNALIDQRYNSARLSAKKFLVVFSNYQNEITTEESKLIETLKEKVEIFAVGLDQSNEQFKVMLDIATTSFYIADSLHHTIHSHIGNGVKFSTFDCDNDIHPNANCVQQFYGAWWYTDCHISNLVLSMSNTGSTWCEMFPKYCKAAFKHIDAIHSRCNKEISAPNRGDENDDKLLAKVITSNYAVVELEYAGSIRLRDILTRLQYFAHFNESETEIGPCCVNKMM